MNTGLILVVCLMVTACNKEDFQVDLPTDAPSTFQYIWRDYLENYGLFEVKQVDWNAVYEQHAAQIDAHTTKAELYRHVTQMLGTLNDRHVTLYPGTDPELPRWSVDLDSAGSYIVDYYNWDVIKENYLTDYQSPNEVIHYGRLNGNIGYIRIANLDAQRRLYEKGLDLAFRDLAESPGLILDIRDNSGGYDPTAQYVAGRFSKTSALYMTSRKKEGPGPDDFAETREWTVVPTGTRQYTDPILVLTSNSTASAAETFLLALLTQDHIRQMGAPTSGNFSDAPMWEAPNGWSYTISVGDYRAANGLSYEGIGLIPEIPVESHREDWKNGKDTVLEKALETLQ